MRIGLNLLQVSLVSDFESRGEEGRRLLKPKLNIISHNYGYVMSNIREEMSQERECLKLSPILPLRNSSSSAWRMLYLSCAFFSRHLRMKCLASSVTGTSLEKQTSSWMMRDMSLGWRISKGMVPQRSSQVRTPTHQMSILLSQYSNLAISGGVQRGVPHWVLRMRGEWTAQPKSQILTVFSMMSMFSGLMSRWMTSCLCMYSTATQTSLMYLRTSFSRKGVLLSRLQRFWPGQASSSRQTLSASAVKLQRLTMLGCERQLWMADSRTSWLKLCSLSWHFSTTFRQNTACVATCCTRYTFPQLPSSRNFSTSNTSFLLFISSVLNYFGRERFRNDFGGDFFSGLAKGDLGFGCRTASNYLAIVSLLLALWVFKKRGVLGMGVKCSGILLAWPPANFSLIFKNFK